MELTNVEKDIIKLVRRASVEENHNEAIRIHAVGLLSELSHFLAEGKDFTKCHRLNRYQKMTDQMICIKSRLDELKE